MSEISCQCPTCSTSFTVTADDFALARMWGVPVEVACARAWSSKERLGIDVKCPRCSYTCDVSEANISNKDTPAPDKTVSSTPKTGCFIATACYGAYEHPSVQEFRWFRDNELNRHDWGRRLVEDYYRLSPPVAGFLRSRPAAAAVVRRCLLGPLLHIVTSIHKRSRS